MGDPRIGKSAKENDMDVPKVEKVGVVGKLVERIETDGTQARNMMKKVETVIEKYENW